MHSCTKRTALHPRTHTTRTHTYTHTLSLSLFLSLSLSLSLSLTHTHTHTALLCRARPTSRRLGGPTLSSTRILPCLRTSRLVRTGLVATAAKQASRPPRCVPVVVVVVAAIFRVVWDLLPSPFIVRCAPPKNK